MATAAAANVPMRKKIEVLPCDLPPAKQVAVLTEPEGFMKTFETVHNEYLVPYKTLYEGVRCRFRNGVSTSSCGAEGDLHCPTIRQKIAVYLQTVKDRTNTLGHEMPKVVKNFSCSQCSQSVDVQVKDAKVLHGCLSRGRHKACELLLVCGKQFQGLIRCMGHDWQQLKWSMVILKSGLFPCMGCDLSLQTDIVQLTCYICNSKLDVQLGGPVSLFDGLVRRMKLKLQLIEILTRTKRLEGKNGYCDQRTWYCPYLRPALEFHKSQCPCRSKVTQDWRTNSVRGLLDLLNTPQTSGKVQKNAKTQEGEIRGTCHLCNSEMIFLLCDTCVCENGKKLCRQGVDSESCLILESISETWELVKTIQQSWQVLMEKFLDHIFNGFALKRLIECNKLTVSVDEELHAALFLCNCDEYIRIRFNPDDTDFEEKWERKYDPATSQYACLGEVD